MPTEQDLRSRLNEAIVSSPPSNAMLNQDEIIELMTELAKRRPVFHSEADFQFALAWLIQEKHPDWSIRLEYPMQDIGAIDILLRHDSRKFLLELKYKTLNTDIEVSGEKFSLTNHVAHPVNRYAGLKDVERIQKSSLSGATIFLSNDSYYWEKGGGNGEHFSLLNGRKVTSETTLQWNRADKALAKGRPAIHLKSSYQFCWLDYADKGFKFLLLMVGV